MSVLVKTILVLVSQVSFEDRRLATVPEDCLYDGDAFFSPDGQRTAYIANRGGKTNTSGSIVGGQYFVGTAAGEGSPYESICHVVFSRSGSLAYCAERNGKSWIVRDGKELGSEYDAATTPFFRTNENRFGFFAMKEGRTYLVEEGRSPERLFDDPFISRAHFSPDGSRVAYETLVDELEIPAGAVVPGGFPRTRNFYVLDGRRLGEDYDHVSDFAFSPDGRRFAFRAKKGQKEFVVIDAKPGPSFDSASRFVFSPDGTKVAYAVKDAGQFQIVFGDQRLGHEYAAVGKLCFSPDGGKLAYKAIEPGEERKERVVLGDRSWAVPGALFGQLAVSPDGGTVAYVSAAEDGKHSLIIDDFKGEGVRSDLDEARLLPGWVKSRLRCHQGPRVVVEGRRREEVEYSLTDEHESFVGGLGGVLDGLCIEPRSITEVAI